MMMSRHLSVVNRTGNFSHRRARLGLFASSSLWGKFGGLHAWEATFPYIMPLPNIFLTRLFSKTRLKRKDFQEIARLPWAHTPRLQQLHPFLLTTNVSNKSRNLLFAQR